MKIARKFAAALIASTLSFSAFADDLTVIELFTSQGCNSCPPADRVLTEIAKRDDVLALSWAVDYWDYLGWKDTYGKRAHTERQSAYNRAFQRRGNYTPQAVVDGQFQAVGSRTTDVAGAMLAARSRKIPTPELVIQRDGLDRIITIGEGLSTAPLQVLLVKFDSEAAVPVRGGENARKTLRYTNIVRTHKVVGVWRGLEERIELPRDVLKNEPGEQAAILLQAGVGGPIHAAWRLDEIG